MGKSPIAIATRNSSRPGRPTALRYSRELGYLATAAICNVPESSLVREADMVLMTRAGPEIGVASTKAFTTQLAALSLLGAGRFDSDGVDLAAALRGEPVPERALWR